MLASHKSPESEGDTLMVMKFWLIACGIYIWEFVTTLDFEWSIIRRHQRHRWTIWIYSVSRLSCLGVIILNLVNFYSTSPINCQAWITTSWTLAVLGGYGLSSSLIMLRIFAIWYKSKVITAISVIIWVINLGFQTVGVVKIRAEWAPAARSCAITNFEICREYSLNLVQFIADVILLFTMLTGLLRLRRGEGSFYLSRLLWKQGVIWLAMAISSQLPLVILVFLNLNDSLSSLFLVPSGVGIAIAATRMYRSLIYSASHTDFHISEPVSLPNFQKTTYSLPSTKDSSVIHKPSNRLEVAVHRAFHEEYPMSQISNYDSYLSSDAQSTDKPHKASTSSDQMSDAEGGDEKKKTSSEVIAVPS